jgi:hypothetical protein
LKLHKPIMAAKFRGYGQLLDDVKPLISRATRSGSSLAMAEAAWRSTTSSAPLHASAMAAAAADADFSSGTTRQMGALRLSIGF